MSVLALGLDHTTAPLDLRARFAFPGHELAPALRALRGWMQRSAEVAIVSTCNRTELYVGAEAAVVDPAVEWLAAVGGVPSQTLRSHAYVLEGPSAARHAFRVASGLASMVIGETQILGQMKLAVREADAAGTLGSTLNHLFQRSFAVAKEVRAGTEIGMHTVSLAAAIVRLAGNLFEDFADLRVLFLGAGEMAAPTLAHLAARGPRQLKIANRSLERGEKLAGRFGAEAIRLSDLPARLGEFDAVISCTASSIISPAPTNRTRTLPRSSNSWPARRTAAAAMLIECAPISVALRTSLATANERWNIWCSVVPRVPAPSASRTACLSWPRICGSPSTIESRPLATRKACRAAEAPSIT